MIRITSVFFVMLFLATIVTSCKEQMVEKITKTYADGSPMVVKYYQPGDTAQTPVKEVQFYKNKQKKVEGYYLDNQRHGEWTFWFANGQVWSHGFFEKGLRVGKTDVYFESGQLFYTGEYKNGQKHGSWQFYNEAGVATQKMIFEDGKIIEQINSVPQN